MLMKQDATSDVTPIPPKYGLTWFQTPTDACRSRCPIPSSMRNNGIPRTIRDMKYGMRKAPAIQWSSFKKNLLSTHASLPNKGGKDVSYSLMRVLQTEKKCPIRDECVGFAWVLRGFCVGFEWATRVSKRKQRQHVSFKPEPRVACHTALHC